MYLETSERKKRDGKEGIYARKGGGGGGGGGGGKIKRRKRGGGGGGGRLNFTLFSPKSSTPLLPGDK